MKKILIGLLTIVLVISITGCKKEEKGSIAFKKDYESINGKENAYGKIHRTITLPEDNVFDETTSSEVLKKIKNKDTFYVYFGSRLCPWCRSVIEKANEVAMDMGISKVYYVDIWDDDGNEILRSKYTLDDNNKPKLEKEGTSDYIEFLEIFKDLLSDYTLADSNGNKVEVGEKRIYAPNFIYIENGVAKKLVSGTSDKQKDSREELTDEMLKDEETIFKSFFTEVCDESC